MSTNMTKKTENYSVSMPLPRCFRINRRRACVLNIQKCSDVLKRAQTCSDVLRRAQTCSDVLKRAQNAQSAQKYSKILKSYQK